MEVIQADPVSPHGHGGGGHGGHGAAVAQTKAPQWLQDYLEKIWHIKKRGSTIELELYTGVVQFISCLYVLPVVPFQMKRAGYDETASIIATALTCCVGCIVAAFLTDMPLIIAPPTSVSIFLAVSMQQQGLFPSSGNTAVMISGICLTVIGAVPALSGFLTRLIPDCIQASTGIGIGMITALAGATELNLVVRGKYTIVDMGPISSEVVIGVAAMILVAVMLHYHIKGAFCGGLLFGTITWWIFEGDTPSGFIADPSQAEKGVGEWHQSQKQNVSLLIFNLIFLYVLSLNGLARSMSDLAGLTKKSGAIPRAGFLFIVCGLTTVLSGYFSGPPILISPESAAGIKAGAKTGLSTLVCGVLFGISVFFYPVFAAVPAAGTAPLLMIVGVVLFNNVKRIDWTDMKFAVPAYCVMFFIPFTYSILRGVAFGYVIYISISLYTGDYIANFQGFIRSYTEFVPKPLLIPILIGDAPLPPPAAAAATTTAGGGVNDGGENSGEEDDANINKHSPLGRIMKYMELETSAPVADI